LHPVRSEEKGLALGIEGFRTEDIMESCKDKNGDTWEIYKSDGWRWRRTAPNTNIVGASAEAYVNKSDCIANAQRNGMTCTPK
jgi:uncharacterized protein YegP (UPF0339 family)